MKLDLIFHNSDVSNFATSRVQNILYKKLLCLEHYQFELVDPNTIQIEMMSNAANLKSMLMFTILNRQSNKAILINLADRLEPNLIPNHGFDSFDVVQIIGGMSISKNYYFQYKEKIESIRIPLMIPVDKVEEDDYLKKYTNKNKSTIKKAIFIGNIYGGRSEIVDILKKHPLFEIKHMIREEGYPFRDYIEEMQKYKLSLSLNGYAEICYRDLESMATYIPIIRSRYRNQYYNELIPNYHYIEGSDPSDNGFLWYNKSSREIADQFIDKIENVINDDTFLQYVANNGRHYYENNCTIEKISQHAFDLINLSLLK